MRMLALLRDHQMTAGNRLDLTPYQIWDEGLPHLDWNRLLETADALGFTVDWDSVTEDWLTSLATAYGRNYAAIPSPHGWILFSPRAIEGESVAHFVETCLGELIVGLPDTARRDDAVVLLLFDTAEDYYRYVCHFFPDGRHGGMGGVQILEGLPHIVAWGRERSQLDATIAHELTHFVLRHLELPQWIEEGLAQMFERHMLGRQNPVLSPKDVARDRRVWRYLGLDLIWNGRGFTRPGRLQGMSYQLADVLVASLFRDFAPRWLGWDNRPRERLMAFLRHAGAHDAGWSAATEHLGIDLSHQVAKYLGEGCWRPSATCFAANDEKAQSSL